MFCRITRVVYYLSYICIRELLLITLIAIKRRHSLDLPSSGISFDTSIVILARTSITIYIYFITWILMVHWSSGYAVGPPIARPLSESVQIQAGATYAFFVLKWSISCQIFCFFSSDKLYKPMIYWYFFYYFIFIYITFPIWVGYM